MPVSLESRCTDGNAEQIELNYGDLMVLTRDRDPAPRLIKVGLEQRAWTVWAYRDIPTGDDAVMLWGQLRATSPTLRFRYRPLSSS